MKKIGFVDYYISEWHANNYPGWIHELTDEYRVSYAWAELDVGPRDGVTTDQWCEKFGAERCATIAELCEKSDVIVILAPGDPDKHLAYAKEVLPFGKRTYIDKTFAPDAAEAAEIFALAEKYGTPFFSTSALRYASELDAVEACRSIVTTGSGRTVDEYIIHQAEMVVKKLGLGAKAVRADGTPDFCTFRVRYDDDRNATMIFSGAHPFTVCMKGNSTAYKPVTSDFFKALIADMVRFFGEGTISFDTRETMEVMRLREIALKALETPDTWVEL